MTEGQYSVDLTSVLTQAKLARAKALQGLFGSNRDDASGGFDLGAIAAKRNKDTLQLTNSMLKTRLSNDLDTTLAAAFKKNPGVKEDFFIAVMTDDNSVEVVKKEDLQKALGLSQEQLQQLSEQPVGYFTKKNFSLKTPSDAAYQDLKTSMTQYFKRNSGVIKYLRMNGDTTSTNSTSTYPSYN